MFKLEMKSFKLSRCRTLWILLVLALVIAGCVSEKNNDRADSSSGETTLEELQIIEERVTELRGLEPDKPVTKGFLTTEQLRQRLEEEFAEDYTEQEVRDDLLLFVAFELMEPDVDLYNLLLDLQTEQIAGFYDADEEELYVITGDQELGPLERMHFSHEYTHALQDQHFDLQALGFTEEEDDENRDSEQQFAIRSLVEGDASLLTQQYAIQYFDLKDLQEAVNESTGIDTSVLDSAPGVLRETLLFPYETGLAFVVSLFGNGGWPAVNAAYDNPPLSTEQILHPERYPEDVPQIVTLPPLTDTLGAGWHLADEDVLGEFGLQLYLEVRLDPELTERAAAGWGGDRYAVHWRDDESGFVLVLRLAWDTPADAAEFFEAYRRFAEDRFGADPAQSDGNTHLWWFGNDTLLLAQNSEDETLILIASDETTLDQVYALFPDF